MSGLLPCIASCGLEERVHQKSSSQMMAELAGRFKLRSIGKQISQYERQSFREGAVEEWEMLSHAQLQRKKRKQHIYQLQQQTLLERAKRINNKHYPKMNAKKSDIQKGKSNNKRQFGSSDSLFTLKKSQKQNIGSIWKEGRSFKIKGEQLSLSKPVSNGVQLMRVSNNRFFRSKCFEPLQDKG